MSNPYVPVVVQNYNVSPPADDGTQVTSNALEWDKHKVKLGDPLKTAIEAIDSNLSTAFSNLFGANVLAKSGNYTVTVSDRGRVINVTAAATITLLPAATAGTSFPLAIVNTSSGAVVVDGDAAETINGDATITLGPDESIILTCDGALWAGPVTRKFCNIHLSKATNYTVVVGDRGAFIRTTATLTLDLPAAATAGDGFAFIVVCRGGTTTIDANASELINGSLTLTLEVGQSAILCSDGSLWTAFTSGVPAASTTVAGIVELDTTDETRLGLDTTRAVTAQGLHNTILSATFNGDATPSRIEGNAGTTGWTIAQIATGRYTITHSLALADVDELAVDGTTINTAWAGLHVENRLTNSFEVRMLNSSGALTDRDFSIIAFMSE